MNENKKTIFIKEIGFVLCLVGIGLTTQSTVQMITKTSEIGDTIAGFVGIAIMFMGLAMRIWPERFVE